MRHSPTTEDWTLKIAVFFAASAFCFVRGASAFSLPVAINPTHFEVTASPGDRVERTFKFWNGTDADLSVNVTGADFSPQGEEGELLVDGPEAKANSLKSWLKPLYPELRVAPKQQITMDFAIDVPANAEPGTHWGTLLVITKPVEMDNEVAVGARIGLVMLVTVLGEVQEKVTLESFSGPRLVETPPVALAARFHNDGTVHEAPQGTIEVRNWFGAVVATSTLPSRNVLPGTVRRIEAPTGGGIWFGRYTARLHATYGEKGEALPESTVTFWAAPWKTCGPWVLTGFAFAGLVIWRRKSLPGVWYAFKTGMPPPKRGADN